jgi:hypothetical protein
MKLEMQLLQMRGDQIVVMKMLERMTVVLCACSNCRMSSFSQRNVERSDVQ